MQNLAKVNPFKSHIFFNKITPTKQRLPLDQNIGGAIIV
jgi:hypothetical protein